MKPFCYQISRYTCILNALKEEARLLFTCFSFSSQRSHDRILMGGVYETILSFLSLRILFLNSTIFTKFQPSVASESVDYVFLMTKPAREVLCHVLMTFYIVS